MGQPPSQSGTTTIRGLLFVVGAVTLVLLGWTAGDQFTEVLVNVRPGHFAASVFLGVLLTLAQGQLFFVLLAKHGTASARSEVIAAFLVSQPGKYIPGKVWPAVMQSIALKHTSGLGSIAVANIELMLVAIIHMTALGAAMLLAKPAASSLLLAIGVMLASTIIAIPTGKFLERLPARLLRWLHTESQVTEDRPVRKNHAFGLSVALVLINLIASVSVLVAAGEAIIPGQYIEILAVFYLGFAASFLALAVPAGIGIREAAIAAFGLALMPGIDASTLISIALLVRCWQLCVDLACLGLGLGILTLRQQLPGPH